MLYEVNDDYNTMIISDMYSYLKEKNISPLSLAYLLACFNDYGLEIMRDEEQFTIKWAYGTRGYDLSFPEDNNHVDISEELIGANFGYATVECTVKDAAGLKYLGYYYVELDSNGEKLDDYYINFKDIRDSTLIFKFEVKYNPSEPHHVYSSTYKE